MTGREGGPYRYAYHTSVRSDEGPSLSEVETLRAIQASLMLLTAGCEVCQYSTGGFCNKHRRHFSPGDPRCEYFARRFKEDPDKATRDQIQSFVNRALGITDPDTVARLTGHR